MSHDETASGTSARLTNGVEKRASSATYETSQCISIVTPTPTARPATAATYGFVPRASASRKTCVCIWSRPRAPVATATKSAMSLPAVNASPSLSNKTARTAGSLSARVNASPTATYIACVSAFFFSGRASVMRRTWSVTAILTCSVMAPSSGCFARRRQLAQHVVQDAAMLEVLALLRSVDAHAHFELDRRARRGRCNDGDDFRRAAVQPDDLERLLAGQAERLRVLAFLELQRQHAHADQVRAVDALEAFGNYGLHAEQHRAFRSPVARRAGAVLLAGQHDERRAFLFVAHRGVIDAHLLAGRHVHGDAAFGARCQLVTEPD